MYVLRIRFTYPINLCASLNRPYLCPYIIRITYTYYLYVLLTLYIYTFLPIRFTYPPYTYTLYLYILLIRYTYTFNLHVILTCSTYNIMCIPTLLSLHFFRPISQKNFFSQNFPKIFPKIIHSIFLKIFYSLKISPKYFHLTSLLCADSKKFPQKKSRISPTLTYNYTLFNQQPLPIIKFS